MNDLFIDERLSCDVRRKWIAVLVVLIFMVACSPLQGYPGDELPAEETVHIYFSTQSAITEEGVSVSSMRVDENELGLFNAGARLLPGEHIISFHYRHWFPDCAYESDRACPLRAVSGECSLRFQSERGNVYRVQVGGHTNGASVFVIEEGSYRAVKTYFCSSE